MENSRFKFRAWDTYSEAWLNDKISIALSGAILFEGKPVADMLQGLEVNIKYMQYTGLKDKNGVEIYEYMEIDDNFEVSFKDGCYILTNISNGDIILLYNYLRDKNGQIKITKEYTKI